MSENDFREVDIEKEKSREDKKIEEIEEFNLPNSDIGRTIVIIRKIKKTQAKYPRKAGLPSKEPLGHK